MKREGAGGGGEEEKGGKVRKMHKEKKRLLRSKAWDGIAKLLIVSKIVCYAIAYFCCCFKKKQLFENDQSGNFYNLYRHTSANHLQ